MEPETETTAQTESIQEIREFQEEIREFQEEIQEVKKTDKDEEASDSDESLESEESMESEDSIPSDDETDDKVPKERHLATLGKLPKKIKMEESDSESENDTEEYLTIHLKTIKEYAEKNKLNLNDVKFYAMMFEKFDTDFDGYINQNELDIILKYMNQNPTEEQLKNDLFPETDNKDSDKKDDERTLPNISMTVFFDELLKYLNDDTDEIETFRLLDENNTGTIPVEEFRLIMTTMSNKMSNEEFEEMMKRCNPTNDPFIDYTALIKKLKAPEVLDEMDKELLEKLRLQNLQLKESEDGLVA